MNIESAIQLTRETGKYVAQDNMFISHITHKPSYLNQQTGSVDGFEE